MILIVAVWGKWSENIQRVRLIENVCLAYKINWNLSLGTIILWTLGSILDVEDFGVLYCDFDGLILQSILLISVKSALNSTGNLLVYHLPTISLSKVLFAISRDDFLTKSFYIRFVIEFRTQMALLEVANKLNKK